MQLSQLTGVYRDLESPPVVEDPYLRHMHVVVRKLQIYNELVACMHV